MLHGKSGQISRNQWTNDSVRIWFSLVCLGIGGWFFFWCWEGALVEERCCGCIGDRMWRIRRWSDQIGVSVRGPIDRTSHLVDRMLRRDPERGEAQSIGMMSEWSDTCQAFEEIGLLGLFGSELFFNAFIDFRKLLLSAWDSQFETRLLIVLM